MTLDVECLVPPSPAPMRLTAGPGEWLVVEHEDPDAAVAAIAGFGRGTARINLDGDVLDGATPVQRQRAQLCVATCRVDPLPTLRVADVVMLGLRAPEPPLWKTLVGTHRARAMAADDEAHVRALAGRTGLARWIDHTAVDLPDDVVALMDVTRALAGLPKSLVWRSPQWLGAETVATLRACIEHEQTSGGFSVVEFVGRGTATLPDQ